MIIKEDPDNVVQKELFPNSNSAEATTDKM